MNCAQALAIAAASLFMAAGSEPWAGRIDHARAELSVLVSEARADTEEALARASAGLDALPDGRCMQQRKWAML
jgi:hypothetical protein